MTLNSSSEDFQAPDPVALLCLSGMPTSVAQSVVDILRAGHCLRETRADFPPVDPGSLVVTELRISHHLPADTDAFAGMTPGHYGMCVTDGTEVTTLLGLLSIASEDVHAQRRAWPQHGGPSA